MRSPGGAAALFQQRCQEACWERAGEVLDRHYSSSVDHDEFVEAFGAAVEAGQASLLIGAGLSVAAGYPRWSELLEPAAQKFGVPPDDDLPQRAQYIENEQGREALLSHVAQEIGGVIPKPQGNHRLLAQLAIPVMWTTNYDQLLETEDRGLEVIEQDHDLLNRSAGKRRLIKMHGSIPAGATEPVGEPDQLVLSTNDYDRYEKTHPRLWRLLQAQFLTSSFCFLGFSMSDPNFDAVFRISRLETPDRMMQHYAVMMRPDHDNGRFDLKAGDLKRSGIEVVEIGDFDQVTLLLKRLAVRTRPARIFASGSFRDPEDEAWKGSGAYPMAEPDQELRKFAQRLGNQLGEAAERLGNEHGESGIRGVVAAGEVGAEVGNAFLGAFEEYESGRLTLIRRTQAAKLSDPLPERRGELVFEGEKPDEVRKAARARSRAVVILGGGRGTDDEAEEAVEEGMSVIPIAHTGRTAQKVWEAMREDLSAIRIGLRPVDPQDFESLASTDPDEAIGAAVRLILQSLSLSQPDGPSAKT